MCSRPREQNHGQLCRRPHARGHPAATDSTRVLRIPGFKNRKYETEFLVQAEKHADRVYHLLDFPLPSDPTQSDFRLRRQAALLTASPSNRPSLLTSGVLGLPTHAPAHRRPREPATESEAM